MVNNLTDEVLEKAKEAKTAEELIALAKENGIELTNEEAKTYFAKLNAKEGEVADDELGDVAGGKRCGTIYWDEKPIITALNSCEYFTPEGTREVRPNAGYCKDCKHGSVSSSGYFLCYCRERRNN